MPEATRTASSHGLEQLGPHPTCSVTLCHCLALSLILRQCLPSSPTRLLSSPRDCALCGGGAPAPGRPPPSTLSRPRCPFSAWRSPPRTAGGCRLRVGLHPPFSSPSLSLGASPPLSTSSTQLWRLVTPLCLPTSLPVNLRPFVPLALATVVHLQDTEARLVLGGALSQALLPHSQGSSQVPGQVEPGTWRVAAPGSRRV